MNNYKKKEREIDFLKNKYQALISNLQIQESKKQTITTIFLSLIVGIATPLYLFTLNLGYFLIAFFVFFIIYSSAIIPKQREINNLQKRIFTVGGLISAIYELDLGVDRKRLEKILKKNYQNFKENVKKAKKERWDQ